MRFFCVLVFLLISFSALHAGTTAAKDSSRNAVQPTYNDPFWAKDKAQHAIGSFFITGLALQSLQKMGLSYHSSRLWAVSFSFSIGVGKEIRDSRQPRNRFSIPDLIADALGIGVAVLLVR